MMSKAEERALEAYPIESHEMYDDLYRQRNAYVKGYRQAEKDLIDKTLDFLKDKLYKNRYVGIIDLCDDYIKVMKDE